MIDVITNSSSETYICVTSQAIEQVHEVLRELVKAFDESFDFDSMFTIKLDIDDEDYVDDLWVRYGYADDHEGESLTLEQKAMIVNDHICENLQGYPVISGITIEANNPWNEHLANKLTAIVNNPFDSDTFYN